MAARTEFFNRLHPGVDRSTFRPAMPTTEWNVGGQSGNQYLWSQSENAWLPQQTTASVQKPSWFAGTQGEWNRLYNETPPEYMQPWLTQESQNQQGVNTQNQQLQAGANALQQIGTNLGGTWGNYVSGTFNPAKNAAIGTMTGAINEFDNSTLANALRQMSDPNYKAMSDEYVGAQRAAGAQAIGKAQANAIGAGLQQSQARGQTGSSLGPQATMAGGFRAAGDRALLNQNLLGTQFDVNTRARQSAQQMLSQRDIQSSQLKQALATTQGSVPGIDPYAGSAAQFAGQAASMRAGAPVYVPDVSSLMSNAQMQPVQDVYNEITSIAEDVRKWAESDRDAFRQLAQDKLSESQITDFLSGAMDVTSLLIMLRRLFTA